MHVDDILIFFHNVFFFQEQNINPKHLAIDKPSFKFSSFLNKHYNLKAVVTQVNNFVVFEGFFNGRTDMQGRRNGKPPAHPPRSHCKYRLHVLICQLSV